MLSIRRHNIGELCKGSTTDSDSVCWGSNPYSPAKRNSVNLGFRCSFIFQISCKRVQMEMFAFLFTAVMPAATNTAVDFFIIWCYNRLNELKLTRYDMVILIVGASHTGKTLLAQKLLEKYKYPYLSIDHLKMGLIRSGRTHLTPMSDDAELTDYLWPIVREIIKTAIENRQNLIVEGCYIPFDWKKDFSGEYIEDIRGYCLVMSESYIREHFDDIKQYANVIENRLYDEDCTLENVLEDNARTSAFAQNNEFNCILIDYDYKTDIDLYL